MVSDTSCDDALKAAQEKGVKIIECGVETAVHDLVLITDQYSIGTQIGDMAADWLNSQLGERIAMRRFEQMQNSFERALAQAKEEIQDAGYPGVEEIYEKILRKNQPNHHLNRQ